jgi:hypothetical protein
MTVHIEQSPGTRRGWYVTYGGQFAYVVGQSDECGPDFPARWLGYVYVTTDDGTVKRYRKEWDEMGANAGDLGSQSFDLVALLKQMPAYFLSLYGPQQNGREAALLMDVATGDFIAVSRETDEERDQAAVEMVESSRSLIPFGKFVVPEHPPSATTELSRLDILDLLLAPVGKRAQELGVHPESILRNRSVDLHDYGHPILAQAIDDSQKD